MDQQITIIVTIDTTAAIKARSLDGHIYFVDDLTSQESVGVGTDDLTTVINGTYWADGSQASQAIVNWLIAGIESLPPTLPRNYVRDQAKRSDRKSLENLQKLVAEIENSPQEANKLRDICGEASKSLGIPTAIKSKGKGGTTSAAGKALDPTGLVVPAARKSDGAPAISLPGNDKSQEESNISLQPPIITNISGEAVDEGILYPVQGGTPIGINGGWYWNATISTYKPGTYSYTMHFTLYNPIPVQGGGLEWEPVEMTHRASLLVKSRPMTNGFTHGAMGLLPIF